MTRRGFTLIEITIYAFLSLLVLMTVYAVFKSGRDAYSTVTDTYLLGKEAEAGLRTLRSDLQETALSSIRITDRSDGDSSLSMISPRKYGSGDLGVTDLGAPRWQKYVFYTAVPERNGQTASLIRWEQAVTGGSQVLPTASTADPDGITDAGQKRVVIRNLYKPQLGSIPGVTADRFVARFVRYQLGASASGAAETNEVLTALNPGSVDLSSPPTGLEDSQTVPALSLVLTVAADASVRNVRFIQLPVFVSPRH